MYQNLAILAVIAFAYSVVAGRVDRSVLTGPIIFLLLGLILGPIGLGLLVMDVENAELRVLADITLALILFIDASNANLKVLRKNWAIPVRMLLIGMPLVILLGVVFGFYLFPGITLFELCILATILAATDAALGKGVITNQDVPARVREGLNVESGVNDGLAVPVLLVFIALATGSSEGQDGRALALTLVAKEIGIGLAVGMGLTLIGTTLATWCNRRGWFSDIWTQVLVVALAVACFATAQSLHGSGYIAAFFGGLVFGNVLGPSTHKLVHSAEGIGEMLAMGTWTIFGAVVVGQAWSGLSWQVLVYSLLSLTVIRVLPMVLSLVGSGESLESKLFLGWFGPRGLASIVFVIIVATYHLPGFETISHTVACTVTLCVLAHGLTANAWAQGFSRRSKAADAEKRTLSTSEVPKNM